MIIILRIGGLCMKGHLGSAKNDKPIRTRLTPKLILECKGTNSSDLIDTVDVFASSYTLLYRIWGNHQMLSFQNKNMGYLEISKEIVGNNIYFRINKQLVNYDNLNQHINVSLTTQNDPLHTPIEYTYSSRITDNALCTRKELSLKRKCVINENQVIEEIKGKKYIRNYTGKLVADFTIYDIVASGVKLSDFTYYENLYSFKNNNKVIASSRLEQFGQQELSILIQYGKGLTERIFYLNKYRIPIMMIQNSVVYILDEYAKQATEILMEKLNTGGVHYEY